MARCFLSLYCPGIAADRLTKIVEWCDRYSPLVSQDGSDGVILDITGCTHLFGGEGPLLLDLRQYLYRGGVESQSAIADAWGIAWALAHYGHQSITFGDAAIAALDPLPVEALRLPAELALELRRLGLSTIEAIRKIPRKSLAARFGSRLLWRLDQASRQAEEPLTPWRPPAPYRAARILSDPVFTVSAVEFVLRDQLREISERLKKDCMGSRRVDLACYRVDGTIDRCEIRTSKPVRSLSHLFHLFSGRLGGLRSGFGFETFILSVLDIETLNPEQLSLSEAGSQDEEPSVDALIDRLGARLGFHEVNRVRVAESYLPEHAVGLCSADQPQPENANWPAYRVRPIRLIDPPMPIEASVLIPGGSPVQFLIGRKIHRIVRLEGPERLTAEWWRDEGLRWKVRDYYRVEDDSGLRFWIFCDSSNQWFLHGHFA